MHLVKHGEDIFKLTEKGIENGKVIICTTCQDNLKYAKRIKKLPVSAFAHYDLGKIPSHLTKLTFGEKLAMVAVIMELKVLHSALKQHSQIASCIREHPEIT